MKSKERRIKDAADVLYAKGYFTPSDVESTAREVLEAADREPPKWPTDKSLSQFRLAHDLELRPRLRAAMLADPIIQAAIAYRDGLSPQGYLAGPRAARLVNAVNEAGL